MLSSPQMGSDVTHWLCLLHEHSSLSSGLAIPLWGCRYPLPCLVLTPHSRSLPLWIPCHLLCSCRPMRAALPSGLSLPCADWDLMLDYSSLGCLINLTGFHPLRPGYHSVDALFILFIVALAHLPCSFPTEILSTPCTGCEFSMPGRLFGGIPSLPLWAKPPFWATLLHGWPSCPHTLFGALSIPSWGSLSDLSSGLISWLPFPALSTSHRCAQALISYTRPSSPAVCTLCSVFLFSFLSYFISYTL